MTTLLEAADEYRLALLANQRSLLTVRYYEQTLSPLMEKIGAKDIAEVSVRDLRQYLADLRSRDTRTRGATEIPGGLSIETIRKNVRGLKAFFNWAWKEYNLPPPHPMTKIATPPPAQKMPKAIELADLQRLLAACRRNLLGIRDRALLLFLADTGARAGGVVGLRLDALMLDRHRAIVHEKGDKQRIVLFSEPTALAVRIWLKSRPVDRPTVFYSLGGRERVVGDPLSPHGLHQAIKRLAKKAGVTGRVNPHAFRHGFAKQWLKNGGNLADLSQIMGHSSFSVTASFYTVFTTDELAARHEMFSPLSNMNTEERRDHP